MILVLHKASLDFLTIVKGKNTNDKDAQSLEERVKEIIGEHDNFREIDNMQWFR